LLVAPQRGVIDLVEEAQIYGIQRRQGYHLEGWLCREVAPLYVQDNLEDIRWELVHPRAAVSATLAVSGGCSRPRAGSLYDPQGVMVPSRE